MTILLPKIVRKPKVDPLFAKKPASSVAAQILLVDENAVSRRRLAQLVRRTPNVKICGEAEELCEAEAKIIACHPDLVVLVVELREATALDWIARFQARGMSVPILVLALNEQPAFAERVLRTGAKGCIFIGESDLAIGAAIRDVLAGEVSVSPAVASTLLRRMTTPTADPRVSRLALLSDRELEIFRLLAAGNKTRDIARTAHLSESTVNSHCFRIRRKLDIKNAARLHYYATNWAGK